MCTREGDRTRLEDRKCEPLCAPWVVMREEVRRGRPSPSVVPAVQTTRDHGEPVPLQTRKRNPRRPDQRNDAHLTRDGYRA